MGRTIRIGRVRCRTETDDGSFRPSDVFVPAAASTTHFLPTVARNMRRVNRITPVEGDPTLLPTVWTMDDRIGEFLSVSAAQEDCMVCPKLLSTSCDDVLFDVIGGTYVEAGSDRVIVPALAQSDADQETQKTSVEGKKRTRHRSTTGFLWLHSSLYPLGDVAVHADAAEGPPPTSASVHALLNDVNVPKTRTIVERCRHLFALQRLQQSPSAVDLLPVGLHESGNNGDDLLDVGSYVEWLCHEQELSTDMSICRDTGMFSSLPTYRSILDSVFRRHTPEFPHRLLHLGDHFSRYHDAQEMSRFESHLPLRLQLRPRRRKKRPRGAAMESHDDDAATTAAPPIQTSEAVMAELFRGASLQVAPVGFPISYLFESDVSVDDILLLRTYRTLSLRAMSGWLGALRVWTGCSEHVLWEPIDMESVTHSVAYATEALRQSLTSNRSKILLPPHSRTPGIVATLRVDNSWCVICVVGKAPEGRAVELQTPMVVESTLFCAEPRQDARDGGDDVAKGVAAATACRLQYQARFEQIRRWVERLFQRDVLLQQNSGGTQDAARRTVYWPKRTDEVLDTSIAALAEATKIVIPHLSHASVAEAVSRPHVEYVALASPRGEAAARLWQVLPLQLSSGL